MSQYRTIRMHVNPHIARAAEAVTALLLELGYHPNARAEVWRYITRTGMIADAPGLEAGDEAAAEEAFIGALPEVSLDSETWDRDQAVTLDSELLWKGSHPFPFDCESGCELLSEPEPPYDPTAEDLDAYDRWLRDREVRYGYE
jgi:hypothetical protein